MKKSEVKPNMLVTFDGEIDAIIYTVVGFDDKNDSYVYIYPYLNGTEVEKKPCRYTVLQPATKNQMQANQFIHSRV